MIVHQYKISRIILARVNRKKSTSCDGDQRLKIDAYVSTERVVSNQNSLHTSFA
jgi:hypothetical protein